MINLGLVETITKLDSNLNWTIFFPESFHLKLKKYLILSQIPKDLLY